MDDISAVSMRLDVFIKNLSIKFIGLEIFYDHANIEYVDKGVKEIKIWSKKFYILDQEDQGMRDVVVAPIKSKNSIREEDLYQLNNSPTITSKMEMFLKQNGDKSIIWSIEKVKMFVKPYLFNSLFAFFTEAFPDYDFSADKPNGYYNHDGTLASKDPGSKMTFIVDIQKSVFLFTEDIRKDKIIVLDGHLNFNFHRENYIECKDLLTKQYNRKFQKEKLINSSLNMGKFEADSEIQMPVGCITLNILDACFKISKTNNIKENKRNFMTPCNIFYSSKSMMEMVKKRQFLLNSEQNINVDKTFLKFSLSDMMMFNNVISFIGNEVTRYNNDKERALQPIEMIDNINKDLDFARKLKTQVNRNNSDDEEFELQFLESQNKTKRINPKFGTERKISETIDHTTSFKFKVNSLRKGTQDEMMIRKTGYFANPDSDRYQSNINDIATNFEEKIDRVEEISQGNNTTDLFLSGLRIVLMNEQSNTYYPVMDINISEVHFEKFVTAKASGGQTATYLS
jgi:hypothetical protein